MNDEEGRAEMLARRLAGPLDAASTARARERVWAALEAPRGRSRTPWLAAVAVAVAAVALLVTGGWLGSYRLEVGAAGVPILYQERVASSSIDIGGVTGSLVVEQLHLHDARSLSVVAAVDLRIAADVLPATVDVSYRVAGSAVSGSLAHEAEVSEVRKELGGARYVVFAPFPPLEGGDVRTYDVWVQVETRDGHVETALLTIEVRGAPEGQRARQVSGP